MRPARDAFEDSLGQLTRVMLCAAGEMVERGRFACGNVLEVSLAFLPSRAPGAPARRGLRDAKVFVCVN